MRVSKSYSGRDFAKTVVNAAVRFVGDDEIEEPDLEVLKALHHRRVGGEVDALSPLGPDHELREGDGDTGFAGASGLDEEGVVAAIVEIFGGALDTFDLIEAVDDSFLRE